MRKLIVLFILIHLAAPAQNKLLTIQEAVLKGRTSLAPKRLQNLTFVKGENAWAYVEGNTLIKGDVVSAKTSTFTELKVINAALKQNKLDTLKALPFITFENPSTIRFTQGANQLVLNIKTQSLTVTALNTSLKESDVDVHKATNNLAYTKDNNLFVSINNTDKKITSDGSFDLVYGKTVHQSEFGIHKGTYWSPNGNFLAFYRMDQKEVFSYPIVDWKPYPAENQNIKYPMAGSKSHHVTLGIYDVTKQTTLYVKTTGDPEQFLTNIARSPDETKIYIAVLNRGQNFMQLNEYDVASGNFIRTLFEEKDEKYVEPLNEMIFLPKNPKQFIWQSRKDGYRHFYLYDISGKELKQLTKGNWEVKAVNGFDEKGERLFFHCNASSPVNQDFYSVNVKSGALKAIASGNGFHSCMTDEKGNYTIDVFTSSNTPRDYSVINTASGKSVTLYKADNPVKEYQLGNWNLFSIKNNEGTDLYCRLFKPVNFDSTKKYPVLVYLYNGPHSQMVTNTWMAGGELWYQHMAQKGFIVFTMDGRGTSYRGKVFEQAIHRQLGTCEMEDQLKGVEYLKSLPYVDANRMGVHGWSYGGFMTTSLMTRNAGVFKVGVAGGPVIDWSYYEIMYGERYMDTPQENKEGYEKNNLLNHVDKLKGKLLMIHGAQDPVVVWQHSMMYLKKCVDKGVQLDYFVYPGHEHNVLGKDRAHLMEKICNYFIDHL
jgi:dipeptidyl-peptidase-4